jgi:hypothetical protein
VAQFICFFTRLSISIPHNLDGEFYIKLNGFALKWLNEHPFQNISRKGHPYLALYQSRNPSAPSILKQEPTLPYLQK